ncbi:SAM-dependent methyltransferase [Acetobacter sp. AN02]|uniref:class I SAM-dependent methyltransferase n=1 Tax=Acetobacter sp. AN02 TaxID=2894186 RepID=UPI002434523E|nr:SAM-dependent methyltransferase [Acetobacter sp. AN02]MDG6094225.1 SAM-dependent methyltransferase [Acetobacter sp. AN02]
MGRANAAYYASRDPFSDFVTSPEISQIFGEILGAWVAVVRQSLPAGAFCLAEAGPGRGTLMSDVLRVLSRVPGGLSGVSVHLVETSLRLREVQKQALARFDVPVIWHDAVEELPEQPFVLLGNEFLDALPVRQFVRSGAGWRERFVQGADWVLCPAEDVPPELAGREAGEGEIVEISPLSLAAVGRLGRVLSRVPGVVLLCDYGTSRSLPGDSLQALRGGRPADPLEHPGEADLTAHVDFQAVAQAAVSAGAVACASVTQGRFLEVLGARVRLAQLCQAAPEEAAGLTAGLDRLMAPDRMGHLFRVLVLHSPGLPVPPGCSAGTDAGESEWG